VQQECCFSWYEILLATDPDYVAQLHKAQLLPPAQERRVHENTVKHAELSTQVGLNGWGQEITLQYRQCPVPLP
jgi:hypothetical protein